jgi:D-glycero-D-manno-heptose 1,7-bisphosphate phosphatase
MKRRAVFIDRDGTISEEVGYVNHPSRFRVFPYAADAVKLLNNNDWLVVVITNQAGVARGYFSEDVILAVHDQLKSELAADGAKLDAIYYCAHHPTVGEPPYRLECDCRKPKPGLIHRAAKDFSIDLDQSWMVGDRYSDIALAHNAGLKSAFVLSGYGRGEWELQREHWKYQPLIVSANLLTVAEYIVGKSREFGQTESGRLGGEQTRET